MQRVCGTRRAAFVSGIGDRTGNRLAGANWHLGFSSFSNLRKKSLDRVIMVSEVSWVPSVWIVWPQIT